eukprot:1140582-Pelagomonas_calceolata.AAC.2
MHGVKQPGRVQDDICSSTHKHTRGYTCTGRVGRSLMCMPYAKAFGREIWHVWHRYVELANLTYNVFKMKRALGVIGVCAY